MPHIFDVLLSVAISFTITFLAIPAIITVAERKKLFDIPDERKVHRNPIPSLGGLGIFAGFIISCLMAVEFTLAPEFPFFLAAGIVIFFLGLKDDILVISPIKKFIGQVLASFLIVYKGGIQIHSMHGFMGLEGNMPETFSLLLTYFTVLVIINSFNLIDGVDGLAGSLGMMSSLILGIYFLQAGQYPYAVMAFSLAGSVAAFLIFNFQPAKIFMGDTGSMLIGMINGILVIKFIDTAASPSSSLPLLAPVAIGFSILLIPLLDTLRVFGIRAFHRRSPFSPDRNHIHHLLLDNGFSHRNITLILVSFNALVLLLVYSFRNYGSTSIILSEVGLFFALIALLQFGRRKSVKKNRPFVRRPIAAKPLVTFNESSILEQKN